MFEQMTFEHILERMLDRVSDSVDKREGSIIYDALAPAAVELAQMYINLDMVMQETFADTASREYLILRAKERGISLYKATNAIGKGIFNVAVPISSRFNLEEYNYEVVELISDTDHSYRLKCETPGAEPNYIIGTLTPVEYIPNLQSAELVEILIPGEDEESTESIRERYLKTFNNQAFGGNREDYKQKVTAISGVGGVKVYRTWNGGGTVKLVIVDSDFKVPSAELLNDVQTAIDPTVNSGDGLGIAPIDHQVTVFGATAQSIDVISNITYAEGWSFEDAEPYINEVLDLYFTELNKNWHSHESIIVRVSQIETRILDFEGVIDIADTTINGVGSNFVLAADSVAVRGEVSG